MKSDSCNTFPLICLCGITVPAAQSFFFKVLYIFTKVCQYNLGLYKIR